MEFFSITNLKQAIQTNPRLQEINNQLMIAKQIASGMNFLHSLNPCVLVKKTFIITSTINYFLIPSHSILI